MILCTFLTEIGDADLVINTATISGADSDDFSIETPEFPLTIAEGAIAQVVEIQCTPSDVGVRTAELKLGTNDPTQSEVVYTLECTGKADLSTGDDGSTTPSEPP